MAEFCLDCWNRLNGRNDPPEKYIISRRPDLCEGCGEWKRVIAMPKNEGPLYRLDRILLPFYVLFFPLKLLARLILRMIRRLWEKRKKKQ